jgi:hydroxymethylpyrimidine pyrophosphatase-like HAD family hydrolase
MIKGLCSDFDSTLRFRDENGNGYFKPDDIRAIEHFQSNGNFFAIDTGRPLHSLVNDIEDAFAPNAYIVSTGAGIYESADAKKILYEYCIPGEICIEIQDAFHTKGHLFCHMNGGIGVFEPDPISFPDQVMITDRKEFMKEHITGISVRTKSIDDAAEMTSAIAQRCKYLDTFQNGEWVDVVGKGVSKGHGALEYKLIKKIECLGGIGDNYNDLPLLKAADVSFTFPYAPAEVQKEADYIVEDEADAIRILEKL